MKSHILLVVNVAKLVAFTTLLALLLVILADKLGAAEHLTQNGDPPIYITAPYPFTGPIHQQVPVPATAGSNATIVGGNDPGKVTYVLNPDGTFSVGPNQCLQPDGNVTIAKPVLDHAEVMMVDPGSTKLTYPPKLVRIRKVPFDGTRVATKGGKGEWWGTHYLADPKRYQTHHFLQVDDAGKEVDAFWDESLPADPEPEPETPSANDHITGPITAGTGMSVCSLSPANGTGVTIPAMSGEIVVQESVPWHWYSFVLPFLAGALCFWLGSLLGLRK